VDSIIEVIEDWFRGLLVSGIMSNITNTFPALNNQVVLGTTVEYLICGVINTPKLDIDSVELLKLFGTMDDKTRQLMLVQMRAVAKI